MADRDANGSLVAGSLATLLAELVDGPAPGTEAFMLNSGDAGLLRSLDRLPADAASARSHEGASIAAHVDHLVYGLSLLNRWSQGERPFDDADWAQSWRRGAVNEQEWSALRDSLRREAQRWLRAVREPRELDATALNTMFGSIAHLAYHLGAIRQIDRATRGPKATDR
jgi:hypothetical protein